MKQFEIGKTYATRSIVDADTWVRITVAKRTAKTITTTEGKTLRPHVYEDTEQVRPWGSYSMCPIIGADDEGRGEEASVHKPTPTCEDGGTRHVYLGNPNCVLCSAPINHEETI